jgi:hypothetical protein
MPLYRIEEIRRGTYLFFAWLLDVGSALRFLLPLSGAGVSLGLVVFCFEALPPKTAPMARSVGVLPLGFGSGLRLLGALPGALIPRPTGPESGSGFLDFGPGAFFPVSCPLSPSASAAWFLEFFVAARACFLSLLRAAASSASA